MPTENNCPSCGNAKMCKALMMLLKVHFMDRAEGRYVATRAGASATKDELYEMYLTAKNNQ